MNRLKKFLALFLALAMILPGIPVLEMPVFAATSGTIGECTWTLNGTELTISPTNGISGAMGDCKTGTTQPWGRSITSVVIEDGVTNVGHAAFYRCGSLTSVSLPESVTLIGGYAFSVCGKLASIDIPEGVTVIEGYAFNYSSSLASISLPSTLTTIGGAALRRTKIKTITIPDKVTSIGANAFNECPSLESVTLGESVATIGSAAFKGCTALTSIKVPDSVTSLSAEAFMGCSALETAVIGNGVESLKTNTFNGCSNLTTLSIGSKVSSIGLYVFSGCTSLNTVTIDSGNTKFFSEGGCIIEKAASGNILFYCYTGTEVTVPTSVNIVGELSFSGRQDLTKVIITANVTEIAQTAFLNCPNLTTFAATGNSKYKSSSGYLLNSTKTTLLFGSNQGRTIPSTVTKIGNLAFDGRNGLTSITIPSTVTEIESHAFNDCTALKSVEFTEGGALTTLGAGVFSGCTALESVTIPDSVTSMERGIFTGCTSLDSVSVSEDNAVYQSANNSILSKDGTVLIFGTKNSTVPSTVTEIGDYAFDGCTELKNITIPDGVTRIGDFAFAGCTSLTSVVIADSVTEIGARAFFGCTSLSSVTLPSSDVKLGSFVFGKCNALTTVALPTGLTAIDPWMFANWGCKTEISDQTVYLGLQKIVVPEGVTTISSAAFLDCVALTTVVLPSTVQTVEYGAFNNCTNLTDVWFCGAEPSTVSTFENGTYINAAKHYIDNPCDAECNDCGAVNPAAHVYSNPCDTECNLCSAVRTAAEHVYDTTCDAECNICAAIRTIKHTYTDPCDEICNVCAFVRSAPHYTFSSCDVVCDLCDQFVKGAKGHSYTAVGQKALCSVCGDVRPFTGTTGDVFYYIDGTHLTIFGSGATVDEFGGSADSGHTNAPWWQYNITSVVVEEGVTFLGRKVFYGCTELTDVVLPTSLTSTGTWDFRGCTSLESIVFPSQTTTIASNAFSGCTNLKTVYIPASVKTVGGYAFYNCTALTDVWYAGTESMKGKISISSSTGNNSALVNATWHYADSLCDVVHKYVSDCDTVCNECGEIREAASHSYDNSCDKICNACGILREVSHVTSSKCDTVCNICSESIAATGHTYDSDCDETCNDCDYIRSALHTYSFSAENQQVTCSACGKTRSASGKAGNLGCFYYLNGTELTIFGNGSTTDYATATVNGTSATSAPWGIEITSVTVEKGVVALGGKSFYGCSNLVSVSLPEGLETIGQWSFRGTSLESIIIPTTVTSIGNGTGLVFYGCTSLKQITLPEALTAIEGNTFSGCSALTTVVIPAGIATVAKNAFNGCTALSDVWYVGTEANKANITVNAVGNSDFSGAEWHYVDSLCDAVCNDCGEVRQAEHRFVSACDERCDSCGFATITDSHVFDHGCDSVCNECGASREVADHVYSNACDADCNICGATRTPSDHIYDNACDAECNVCGSIREVADHVYDNDCDTDCNICGAIRTPSEHIYSNACDTDCNECGAIREVADHVYSNACDADCNICGAVRTPSDHVYDNACDADCNVCGAVRTGVSHKYDNTCDTDCNVCGAVREIEHTYGGDCDAACNVCGAEREANGEHIFTDLCDGDCDACGFLRAAPHSYVSDCDEKCNICWKERTAADHNFNDNCDRYCNDCGESRSVVHSYSAACDTECDRCASVRTALTAHSYLFDSESGKVTCSVCQKTEAYSGTTGDVFYYLDGTALTVYGNGAMGSGAPWGTEITSVTIAEGVTEIGTNAFYGCKNLVSASVPATVTVINQNAFANCISLTDVTLSKGLEIICADAFKACNKVKNIWFKGTKAQADSIAWEQNTDSDSPVTSGSGSAIRPGQLTGLLPGFSGAVENTGSTLSGATWHYTAIVSRSFLLHSSINATLYANVDSAMNAAGMVMRFTMNGKETISSASLFSGNTYVFTFEGIAPQCMNDTIVAELIIDGVVWDVKSFSVRAYCDSMLSLSASDLNYTEEQYQAAKTMMLDLLNYGSMAQQYMGYKADSLVNSGLSEAEAKLEEMKKINWENALGSEWNKSISASDGTCSFKSANVWFDNENRLYFKFVAPDIDETNFFVRIYDTTSGKAKDYTLSQFEALSGDTYGIFSAPISVCNFNHRFEITLCSLSVDHKGDRVETAHQTLSNYGINSYIYSAQNKQDAEGNLTNMALLARACYSYGVSANVYADLI